MNPKDHIPKKIRVDITIERKVKIVETIRNAVGQLAFLEQLVKADAVTAEDVETHMGLYRRYYEELSERLGRDDSVSEELNKANASLRDAHARIRTLEAGLASETSCAAAVAKIKSLDDLFEAWYNMTGLHYASTSHTPNGVAAEFSDEIEPSSERAEREETLEENPSIPRGLSRTVPYAFDEGYDLESDGLRVSLLDTDENRKKIEKLFTTAFPNSQIRKFESRRNRNGGNFSLRFTVFVPFRDIDDLRAEISK